MAQIAERPPDRAAAAPGRPTHGDRGRGDPRGGRARRERGRPRADRVGPDVLRDLRLAADPGAAVRPARGARRGARRGVRADRGVREARGPPAAAAAPRGRAGGARVPDLRVRLGAGRAPADAARPDALGGRHVHARRAGAEPGRDRLDVRRVPRADHAVDDGRRPLPPRHARRDRRRVGRRQPLQGRAAQAEPRGGRRTPARARTSRGAVAALLRASRQRLPVHGALPAARRDDRGGDPDVPARRRC